MSNPYQVHTHIFEKHVFCWRGITTLVVYVQVTHVMEGLAVQKPTDEFDLV